MIVLSREIVAIKKKSGWRCYVEYILYFVTFHLKLLLFLCLNFFLSHIALLYVIIHHLREWGQFESIIIRIQLCRIHIHTFFKFFCDPFVYLLNSHYSLSHVKGMLAITYFLTSFVETLTQKNETKHRAFPWTSKGLYLA